MLTLHRLNLGYRLLYSGVLMFMTAGTIAHGIHQQVRAGILPRDVAAWYRGNAGVRDPEVLLFPKPLEEVMADVSSGLVSYTFALLIFGGILFRATGAPALRTGLLTGYALGAVIAATAPLPIRYIAPGFAYAYSVALAGLPVLAVAMTALALYEMWIRRGDGPRVDRQRPV